MFSELSDKELNSMLFDVMQRKKEASETNDEIQWKALFSIEQDISSEMRQRAIVVKQQILAGLFPKQDKGDK
jgi:hypothetical protein